MSAEAILSLFGGASGGTAIVFCALFVSGAIVSRKQYQEIKDDRDDWKRIAELERTRADAGLLAAQTVKDVWTGLRKELEKP